MYALYQSTLAKIVFDGVKITKTNEIPMVTSSASAESSKIQDSVTITGYLAPANISYAASLKKGFLVNLYIY